MSVQPVDLEKIKANSSNLYEGVVIASKKAREINDTIKLEFKKRIEEIPMKKESDDQEEIENPEQVKIAKEFEKYGKPTEAGLKELLDGNVKYHYKQI